MGAFDAKFTKGPWYVDEAEGDLWQGNSADEHVDSTWIATVSRRDPGHEEFKADLWLIAAAPDLYAALLRVRDALASGRANDSDLPERIYGTLEDVLAALAKARGVE